MSWSHYIGPIVGLSFLILVILGVFYLPIPKNQTLLLNSKLTSSKDLLVMESKCRKILEEFYNVEFNKIRPPFLRNPKTNKNLELDGYNAQLKIAFEYNGSQHYFYNPHFHKNIDAFNDQVKKDKLKAELCKKNNIHLIVIPYHLRENELSAFIHKNLPVK